MVDQTFMERLQPSLLDRLSDDAPAERVERKEDRVIDLRALRDIVQRDLAWLLNTTNNDDWLDPERYPHAARSVLNYGVSSLAGDFTTRDRTERIRRSIRKAVEQFEPRIRAGSVDVVLREEEKGGETFVHFDIHADLWARPLPVELYLRSAVDLTTGELSLERVP